MPNRKGFWSLPLCCRTVGTSVESSGATAAAFFDPDKTLIATSSMLAFAPSSYRHGLISRTQVCGSAFAKFTFRLAGASHDRMERAGDHVGALCCGWAADEVARIVTESLTRTIVPHLYCEAPRCDRRHRDPACGSRRPLYRAAWISLPTVRPRPTTSATSPPSGVTGWLVASPAATRWPTCRCLS